MNRCGWVATVVGMGMASFLWAAEPAEVCDQAVLKIRRGEVLTEAEQFNCRNFLNRYYQELAKKYNESGNAYFGEPDRTLFYIAAVKTTMADPVENGGWPFRSTLHQVVLKGLKGMIASTNDPFLVFCAIFPALDCGQRNYAVSCFETLQREDAFLATLTLKWSAQYYGAPDWLVDYYLADRRTNTAMDVVNLAAKTGHMASLEMKARLVERLGQFDQAEACYKEIEKHHHYLGPLVSFYLRHRDWKDAAGMSLGQRYEELSGAYFPQGLRKVGLEDCSGPPAGGAELISESGITARYGLRKGDVIVALDGYRVASLPQYYFIRETNASTPLMKLIVWNGEHYTEVEIKTPTRRLGVDLKTYGK